MTKEEENLELKIVEDIKKNHQEDWNVLDTTKIEKIILEKYNISNCFLKKLIKNYF